MSKNTNARDHAKGHGKEIKIGLGVLGLLLIALCAVGVMKFMGDSDAPTASIAGSESAEDAFAKVDQSPEPTLLQSDSYPASAGYSGASQSGVDWTKSANQSAAADDIPSRPLSAKASDPIDSDTSTQSSRIPSTIDTSANASGVPTSDSYDATSGGSTIPPSANTAPDYSARGQSADLAETTTAQTIPTAAATRNASELDANRIAMRPASANQIAQQEYQPQVQQNTQAYDPTTGYANAAAQNAAALQGSIPSQSPVLPADQTSEASQYANSDQYAPAQNIPAQNVPGQYAQENRPAEVPNYDAPSQYKTQYSDPTQYSVPQSNANYSQQQRQVAPQPLTPQPLGNVEIDQEAARKGRAYIQPGETMWTLSRRVYGSSAFFKALSEHNRQRLPNSHDLKIGDEVLTPKVAVLRQRYPGLCPRERKRKPGMSMTTQVSATMIRAGRTYVVEKGDTLYDIARYELGSGAQWPAIYQLNQRTLGDDFDYLKPGTKLTLPARAARPANPRGDALAERPGRTIRQ